MKPRTRRLSSYGSTGFNLYYTQPNLGAVLLAGVHDGHDVLAILLARRVVAVQVAFESKTLKPVHHISGAPTRVETRRRPSSCNSKTTV